MHPGFWHDRLTEVRIIEQSTFEIGLSKKSAAQVCASHIGIRHLSLPKKRAAEVSTIEIAIVEIRRDARILKYFLKRERCSRDRR